MEPCKAIIQEGSRKGQRCKFPPGSESYCGRHLRNKKFDDGVAKGKTWCRFFFRGCNNEANGSCDDCKNKLSKKLLACKHKGCKFKVIEGDFCKKHERDKYYIEENEKGIQYCDIARGCFTIVKEKNTCEPCLEKLRNRNRERYKNKKDNIKATEIQNTLIRSCVKCAKDFKSYKTKFNKDSMHCLDCSAKQCVQDKKRENRERNYKKERLGNLETSYKYHVQGSLKRGYGDFEINFEDFKILVRSPCHYCKQWNEEEAIGIDRVNNDLGYTKNNCVPACWICNRMKHFYHPEFFIEKCKIISKNIEPTKEFYIKWSTYYTRSCHNNYTNYKRVAEETRKLPFEINQEQWDWLTRSACYLCGYKDARGIGLDRIDNTVRKYTIENCRPCCGSCNSMKGEIILEKFLEQCSAIASSPLEFKEIPLQKNPLKETEDKAHLMNPEDRVHWKSKGLYYAILSDTAPAFQQSYNDVFTLDEYTTLCKSVKESTKEVALSLLKDILVKLKKRKYRLTHKITGNA